MSNKSKRLAKRREAGAAREIALSESAIPQRTGAWAGLNSLMWPGAPRIPVAADEPPRMFEYADGVNLFCTPRTGFGLLPYSTLRAFAENVDIVRIVIEAFKREMRAQAWDIVPEDSKDDTDYSAEIQRLRKWWAKPNGSDEFDGWLNTLLEDLLVLDAPSVYLEQDARGNVTGAEVIDGSTIRPLLDVRGRTPPAPLPAYTQVLRGVDAIWMTRERMLYRPFNRRANSPYGRSPSEYLLVMISTYLNRAVSALKYWDQTNIPEALLGLPEKWGITEIEKFQEYFDALLAGNADKLRRIKFVPIEGASIPVHEFRRPDIGDPGSSTSGSSGGSGSFDLWMMKMACWAFGFLPSEFGITDGRGLGGSGFMEAQADSLYRFGVGPVAEWVQSLCTTITQALTDKPLVWKYTNLQTKNEDQTNKTEEHRLRNGIEDINVSRKKYGQEPIKNAKPFIVVGSQVILLDELFAEKAAPQDDGSPTPPLPNPSQREGGSPPPAPPPMAQPLGGRGDANEATLKLALGHWLEKCKRRMVDGKAPVCDPPELAKAAIGEELAARLKGGLAMARTREEVSALFDWQLVKKKLMGGGLAKSLHATPERDAIEEEMTADVGGWLTASAGQASAQTDEQLQALQNGSAGLYGAMAVSGLAVLTSGLTAAAQHGVMETLTTPPFVPAGAPIAAVGVAWDVVNDEAARWAAEHAGELITQIVANTQGAIADLIAKWIVAGKPLVDLQNEIFALVGDMARARLIAQTETTNAFAAGNRLAWKARGLQGTQWHTVRDDRVCPTCRPNHGERRGWDDAFPSGHQAPSAHPGCRCYVTPVEVI